MNDQVTYAVFYKYEYEDDEAWRCFSGWFYTYEEAKREAKHVKRTARSFVEIRIVERVETFHFIG